MTPDYRDKIDLAQCVDDIRPYARGTSNPTVYRLADIYTKITGVAEPIRALLVIDSEVPVGGKGRRYFSVITTDTKTAAAEFADQYRFRWRQERSYRVGKHNLYFDVLPHVTSSGKVHNRFPEQEALTEYLAWPKDQAVVTPCLQDRTLHVTFGQAVPSAKAFLCPIRKSVSIGKVA